MNGRPELTSRQEEWLHHNKIVKRHSGDTLRSYHRTLTYWNEFLYEQYTEEGDQFTPLVLAHFQNWLMDQYDYAASTVKTMMIAMSSYCSWMVGRGDLETNPCSKVKRPEVPGSDEENGRMVLTTDEQAKLLRTCPGDSWVEVRDQAIIRLMMKAGLRMVEIYRLDMEHLRLDDGYIWVHGNGRKAANQKLPLHREQVIEPLREWLALREQILGDAVGNISAVFISSIGFGKRLSRYAIADMVRRRMRQSKTYVGGGRKTAHSLRHTFVTNLANSGCPIHKVQALARHQDIQTTQRYVHATELDEAVERWVR